MTMRVAVVGAGPAGMYAIERLLERRGLIVEIDLYERLPTPWGLVRAGVAPDHPEKRLICDRQFDHLLKDPRVRFIGGVEIGLDIAPDELSRWYNAVIYAVGAASDTRMGIPGEELPGCRAAREFVAFYNGHPDFSERQFDLSSGRAVVVGNGNVALDVARILTLPIAELEKTDIADHALKALRGSRIREVVIIGRRGQLQAAFNNSELEEFEHLSGVDVTVEGEDLLEPGAGLDVTSWETRRKLDTLRRLTSRQLTSARKRIVIRFLASPLALIGQHKVQQVSIQHNRLVRDTDGYMQALPDDETSTLDAGLVLRAIGYRGVPLPGLPFDQERGVIRNQVGRVVDSAEQVLRGVYVSGWVKRGCRGIIGSNRKCARETVNHVFDDWALGHLEGYSMDKEHVLAVIRKRQPNSVSLGGWLAIDRKERDTGRQQQRPRVKLTDIAALHEAAHGRG